MSIQRQNKGQTALSKRGSNEQSSENKMNLNSITYFPRSPQTYLISQFLNFIILSYKKKFLLTIAPHTKLYNIVLISPEFRRYLHYCIFRKVYFSYFHSNLSVFKYFLLVELNIFF